MGLPSVSVCFPAYNEEESVKEVLEEAHALLSGSGLDYEILVCDDGSADRTAEIIRETASRIPHVRALFHERNQGIRATFEHLYSAATKEFVFLNSTDRQWKTEILFEMLPMTRDWDIIVASRKRKHYSPARRFVSWGFNVVPRVLFRAETYDAGAVKLVRREVIERFEIVSQSPFNEAERLIRAARAGYRITEYRVDVSERQIGKARGASFGSVTEAAKDVFRVWLALRRERKENKKDALAK